MKIIGHRGARGLVSENTPASITRALDEDVDGIEIDARLLNGKLYLSHDPLIPGQNYPTLRDALSTVSGRVMVNIELKAQDNTNPEVVASVLKKELDSYKGLVIISSFDYTILKCVASELPKVQLAVLERWSGMRAAFHASKLHTKRVHINDRAVWAGYIRAMKRRGYEVYVYTVNDVARAQRLQQWGVDGVCTDYPDIVSNRNLQNH